MEAFSIGDRYFAILAGYATSRDEEHLMAAADLGRELVEANAPPEDIAELHEQGIIRLARESPTRTLIEAAGFISKPLIELLMAYGLAYRELVEQQR